MKKRALTLFLLLASLANYAQPATDNAEPTVIQNQSGLVTLGKFIDKIKSENQELRNVKAVNVMVNDLLIENLSDYLINPKNIATQEILVLNANGTKEMRASIIINTKNRQQITKL